jgi:RNA-directed DNA polymerase
VKRQAVTLNDLAARENLVLATYKAAAGKRHTRSVAAFLTHLDARLESLARHILQGQAPSGGTRQFVIHDPKRRTISAASFDDRVLHHAILSLTEARFERALVSSVYACRLGKGVHAAVAAVQRGLQRNAWVVQVDVDGYFPSIDHAVLKAQLARRFKGNQFLALLNRIIDCGSVMPGRGLPRCGLPIGALTSQHFANGYLNSADRLLLAYPGVKAHVRYMDDMVWFCSSRTAADASLEALREHLGTELKLRLKHSVVLRPCSEGLRFCGFRIRAGVVLPSARKLMRYRAAVQRLRAAEQGGMAPAQLQRAHDGNAAGLLPAQSLHFRRRLWWGATHPPLRKALREAANL